MITVADVGEVSAAFAIPMEQILDSVPALRRTLLPPSPFPGLRPFTGEHGYALVGRDTETADLVALLDERRHVGLVGSSGAGKSSLLRAGIVPRLRERGDTVVVLRPSGAATPLDALGSAIAPLLGQEPDVVSARLVPEGLRYVTARLGSGVAAGRLVVVVDQLEEVFDCSPGQCEALIGVLLGEAVPPSVRVIAALRQDFLGHVLADPRLRLLVQAAGLFTVSPLGEDGLRTVMVRPDASGQPTVDFESGLVDRILVDARGSGAPLPLLSHVLDLMWRDNAGQMTHRAYYAAGGLTDAFEKATARWLDDIPTGGEVGLPRLFARLVGVSGVTATPTRRAVRIDDVPQSLHPLVRGLTTAGILTATTDTDGEVVVELAHDALVTAWRPLRDFVDEDRAFLIWSDLLQHDAYRWVESGRAAHRLPTRAELDVAATWGRTHGDHLSPRQREFLAAGLARARRGARRRRALIGLTALSVVVLLVLGTILLDTRAENADRQRTASSSSLAAASVEVETGDPALAILTAVAAYRTAPTQEARDQLLNLYLSYGDRTRVLSGMPGGLKSLGTAQSDDGEVVLASTRMNRAYLAVDVMSGPVRQRELPVSRVQSVLVSADGRRAVYVQSDGGLGWFEVRPHEPDLIGPVHEMESWAQRVPEPPDAEELYNGWPHSVGPSLSRDGQLMAMRVWDRFVWWDLESGRIAGDVAAPYETLWDMWVGPHNDELLVPLVVEDDSLEQDLVAIDLADGSHRTIARGGSAFRLSGDRETAIRCQAGQESGAVTQFRVRDGRRLREPFGYPIEDGGNCDAWIFDISGDRAGTSSGQGRALLDLAASKKVQAQYLDTIGFLEGMDAERFVERPGGLLGVSTSDTAISYLAVPKSGDTIDRTDDLVLAADGSSSIVRTDEYEGEHLLQVRDGTNVLVEREPLDPGWHTEWIDELQLSPAGDLVASREGRDTVAIRDAETLKLRTKIVTRRPEDRVESGRRLLSELITGWPERTATRFDDGSSWLTVDFDSAGNLVTVSDGQAQYWDSVTGREIASLDVQAVRGVGDDVPVAVEPYWKPGTIAVTVPGEPGTSVVDLRTGEVLAQISTGDDVLGVRFDPAGRYVATYRVGGTIEVFEAESFVRVLGPLPDLAPAPLKSSEFAAEFLSDGRFLVGDSGGVRVYRLDGSGHFEAFRFAGQQGGIESVSHDGATVVLRGESLDDPNMMTVRLDPEAWVETLCQVVAHREFTTAELATLHSEVAVPTDICAKEAG